LFSFSKAPSSDGFAKFFEARLCCSRCGGRCAQLIYPLEDEAKGTPAEPQRYDVGFADRAPRREDQGADDCDDDQEFDLDSDPVLGDDENPAGDSYMVSGTRAYDPTSGEQCVPIMTRNW
jgi:hypothetical protein